MRPDVIEELDEVEKFLYLSGWKFVKDGNVWCKDDDNYSYVIEIKKKVTKQCG